jgi:ribosomal-protein-alanine N-acetyltransferase
MLNLFSRPTEQLPLQVRWLVTADMPAVVEIAAHAFDYPWLEGDFAEALRITSVLGIVAEREGRVVGYAIYETHIRGFTLLNVGVAPLAQGSGVGRALVAKLVSKLEPGCTISAIVNERQLPAQLWLKALGFEAISVLREHFDERPDDPPEDGYIFRYQDLAAPVGTPLLQKAE